MQRRAWWMAGGVLGIALVAGYGLRSARGGLDARQAIEESLLADLSKAAMERHTREIATHSRESGSDGERRAIEYVRDTLEREGVGVRLDQFEAYVSWPGAASVTVLAPEQRTIEAATQAFAAPTGAAGITGDLVYAADYSDRRQIRILATPEQIRGKIAIVDGQPWPDPVFAMKQAGALACIFVRTDDRPELLQLTITPIWGHPTPDKADQIPQLASVFILKPDGDRLKALLRKGRVRATLRAEVTTAWRPHLQPVVEIPGAEEPDAYVLFGGHIDGWWECATDEAASNALMMEAARLFHKHRASLRRGIKIVWWTGHSAGRYAGSTWFADSYWHELNARAVAYMNIDGAGSKGASIFRASASPEAAALAKAVVKELHGEEIRPGQPNRNSDQTFFGVGLPSLSFSVGIPDALGGNWWWHTKEDTIDKVDFDHLYRDARIHLVALARLMNQPLLPYSMRDAADAVVAVLQDWQRRAGERFSLAPAVESAQRLQQAGLRLEAARERAGEGGADRLRRLNHVTLEALKRVNRVYFTRAGAFEHDPAMTQPAFPGFAGIARLESLAPGSDLFRFELVALTREQNRVVHVLDEATRLIEQFLGSLS